MKKFSRAYGIDRCFVIAGYKPKRYHLRFCRRDCFNKTQPAVIFAWVDIAIFNLPGDKLSLSLDRLQFLINGIDQAVDQLFRLIV